MPHRATASSASANAGGSSSAATSARGGGRANARGDAAPVYATGATTGAPLNEGKSGEGLSEESVQRLSHTRQQISAAQIQVDQLKAAIEQQRTKRQDGGFEKTANTLLPGLRSTSGGRRQRICERRTLKASGASLHNGLPSLPATARVDIVGYNWARVLCIE